MTVSPATWQLQVTGAPVRPAHFPHFRAAASCSLSPPWCACPPCELLNRVGWCFHGRGYVFFYYRNYTLCKAQARHYGRYIERFGLKGAYSLIRQRNELRGQWWAACRRSKDSALHTELLLLNIPRKPGDQVSPKSGGYF